MAASGAMADFARMPTNRKVLVFVLIGLVLGLLYWRFLFKNLEEKVKRTEGEHASLVQLNKQLEADIPRYAVLRQEMAACLLGIGVGIIGAALLSSLLQSLLFGVPARDTTTLAVASLVLLVVTVLACLIPARRATRVDPVTALRLE